MSVSPRPKKRSASRNSVYLMLVEVLREGNPEMDILGNPELIFAKYPSCLAAKDEVERICKAAAALGGAAREVRAAGEDTLAYRCLVDLDTGEDILDFIIALRTFEAYGDCDDAARRIREAAEELYEAMMATYA
jgi:hypothetical protein